MRPFRFLLPLGVMKRFWLQSQTLMFVSKEAWKTIILFLIQSSPVCLQHTLLLHLIRITGFTHLSCLFAHIFRWDRCQKVKPLHIVFCSRCFAKSNWEWGKEVNRLTGNSEVTVLLHKGSKISESRIKVTQIPSLHLHHIRHVNFCVNYLCANHSDTFHILHVFRSMCHD